MRCLGAAGLRAARRLAASGARCAQVPRQVATRDFIQRAHAVGLDVHVWTLNSREGIERALNLGADGVMTDDVVLLRDILAERGRWHPRVAA
jgi:glycerophosphoryl diester phosphodiesterase